MRAACARVVVRARDVRIGPLDAALDAIAGLPVPSWDHSRHYAGPRERTLRYLVVLDTINFSFWGGAGGGYRELAERLRDVFITGDELAVPEGLARVTPARLRRLLGDFPMLAERAGALRELGQAGFEDLVEDTATGTARALAARLPSYADRSSYEGRAVPLLKRAQILASDLDGAGVCRYPDVAALTCFADYKLPQILRHWGALEYGDGLARRIDRLETLRAGEPAEVEIRAATVVAVERLCEALGRRGRRLTARDVDWILWEASQGREDLRPYHRVRTVFY